MKIERSGIMSKVTAAIMGTGNIGTDVMYKLEDRSAIELTAMIGIDPDSDGLKRAKEKGYIAFSNGIEAVQKDPNIADLVFDATSAEAHEHHAKILKKLDKMVIDLTPAAVGPFFSPAVGKTDTDKGYDNVNMITCGGQATVPM